MPWIKLSDKPPKFDVLIELAFEGAVFQAMLTTITGAGATFEIYFKEKTEKKILNPEETYWQDKQQGPGAPKIDAAGKQRSGRTWTPEQKTIAAERAKQKRAEIKAAANTLNPTQHIITKTQEDAS